MINQAFNRISKFTTKIHTYPYLQLIQRIQVAIKNTSPGMATVLHVRLYGRFVEVKNNSRKRNVIGRIKASVFFPTIFRQGQVHSFFSSIAPMLLELSNETSKDFQANQQAATCPNRSGSLATFKFRRQLQYLPQIRSQSLFKWTVISAQIAILQVTSSGRRLTCSRKRVEPRMEP